MKDKFTSAEAESNGTVITDLASHRRAFIKQIRRVHYIQTGITISFSDR